MIGSRLRPGRRDVRALCRGGCRARRNRRGARRRRARAASAADEAVNRAFASARREIEEVIGRPRAVVGPEHHEAVDEIDVILDDLLSQLDQSDVLTAVHSRTVLSWCSRLATRLGSSKEQIVHLSRAGLIHDIGKVTTPLEILTAPRALTDEEFAVMRHHAEAGAMIVREIALIENLTPAVLSHHERFDGRGYPECPQGGSDSPCRTRRRRRRRVQRDDRPAPVPAAAGAVGRARPAGRRTR